MWLESPTACYTSERPVRVEFCQCRTGYGWCSNAAVFRSYCRHHQSDPTQIIVAEKLSDAVRVGDLVAVKQFRRHALTGVDWIDKRRRPLSVALEHWRLEIVRYLAETLEINDAAPTCVRRAMCRAARSGELGILRMLIATLRDSNGVDAALADIIRANPSSPAVRVLLKARLASPIGLHMALRRAVSNIHTPIFVISELLRAGAPGFVRGHDSSAIFDAACALNTHAVELLCSYTTAEVVVAAGRRALRHASSRFAVTNPSFREPNAAEAAIDAAISSGDANKKARALQIAKMLCLVEDRKHHGLSMHMLHDKSRLEVGESCKATRLISMRDDQIHPSHRNALTIVGFMPLLRIAVALGPGISAVSAASTCTILRSIFRSRELMMLCPLRQKYHNPLWLDPARTFAYTDGNEVAYIAARTAWSKPAVARRRRFPIDNHEVRASALRLFNLKNYDNLTNTATVDVKAVHSSWFVEFRVDKAAGSQTCYDCAEDIVTATSAIASGDHAYYFINRCDASKSSIKFCAGCMGRRLRDEVLDSPRRGTADETAAQTDSHGNQNLDADKPIGFDNDSRQNRPHYTDEHSILQHCRRRPDAEGQR